MTIKVVVGGSGFLGSAVARHCARRGAPYVTLDRHRPVDPHEPHVEADLLTDPVRLPAGDVILVAGNSMPRVRRPWELVLGNVVTAARLAPQLVGRRVVLASSIEAGGRAGGPDRRRGLPVPDEAVREWLGRLRPLTAAPCPAWRVAALCAELVDGTGRWAYGVAKRAQELVVADAVGPGQLTVVRLGNLFGPGQDRVLARLTRRAQAGLPLRVADTTTFFLPVDDAAGRLVDTPPPDEVHGVGVALHLIRVAALVQDVLGTSVPVVVGPAPDDGPDLDALASAADRTPGGTERVESAMRAFVAGLAGTTQPTGPPLAVVVPPRPDRPDVIADRQQEALRSGRVKSGNRWTTALGDVLSAELELGADRRLLLCASGTAALRLAVVAAAGTAAPGDVAVLPSFTFAATAEALVQLGYRLRFVDVDPATWTMDPAALERALAAGAAVVVAVDTLGAPADYARLRPLCRRAGVPLVADSAPSLGARWAGRPVGSQTVAHAFSMSFAKVVSAAGAGGALTVMADRVEALTRPVDWLRSAQLGEVHAVVALEQVERLSELVRNRQEVAAVYDEFAASRDDVIAQRVRPGDRHALVHWVARFPQVDRDDLQRRLAGAGIDSKPYYAPALHRQDWAGWAEPSGDLAVTATIARDVLALPMSSELTAEDAERVVGALGRALAGARPRRAACPDRSAPHIRPGAAHDRAVPSSPNAAVR